CEEGGSASYKASGDETNGGITITNNNCKEPGWDEGDYDLTDGKISLKFSSNTTVMTFNNFKTVEYWDGETSTSTSSGTYKISGIKYSEYTGENQAFTAEWNLSGTENGKPIATNGTLSCDVTGECTVGSVVTTESGKTYKVENMSITETGYEGYQLEAKLYHPDYGYYTIEANVDEECDSEDLSPFVGTATLSSSEGVITYSSSSCNN